MAINIHNSYSSYSFYNVHLETATTGGENYSQSSFSLDAAKLLPQEYRQNSLMIFSKIEGHLTTELPQIIAASLGGVLASELLAASALSLGAFGSLVLPVVVSAVGMVLAQDFGRHIISGWNSNVQSHFDEIIGNDYSNFENWKELLMVYGNEVASQVITNLQIAGVASIGFGTLGILAAKTGAVGSVAKYALGTAKFLKNTTEFKSSGSFFQKIFIKTFGETFEDYKESFAGWIDPRMGQVMQFIDGGNIDQDIHQANQCNVSQSQLSLHPEVVRRLRWAQKTNSEAEIYRHHITGEMAFLSGNADSPNMFSQQLAATPFGLGVAETDVVIDSTLFTPGEDWELVGEIHPQTLDDGRQVSVMPSEHDVAALMQSQSTKREILRLNSRGHVETTVLLKNPDGTVNVVSNVAEVSAQLTPANISDLNSRAIDLIESMPEGLRALASSALPDGGTDIRFDVHCGRFTALHTPENVEFQRRKMKLWMEDFQRVPPDDFKQKEPEVQKKLLERFQLIEWALEFGKFENVYIFESGHVALPDGQVGYLYYLEKTGLYLFRPFEGDWPGIDQQRAPHRLYVTDNTTLDGLRLPSDNYQAFTRPNIVDGIESFGFGYLDLQCKSIIIHCGSKQYRASTNSKHEIRAIFDEDDYRVNVRTDGGSIFFDRAEPAKPIVERRYADDSRADLSYVSVYYGHVLTLKVDGKNHYYLPKKEIIVTEDGAVQKVATDQTIDLTDDTGTTYSFRLREQETHVPSIEGHIVIDGKQWRVKKRFSQGSNNFILASHKDHFKNKFVRVFRITSEGKYELIENGQFEWTDAQGQQSLYVSHSLVWNTQAVKKRYHTLLSQDPSGCKIEPDNLITFVRDTNGPIRPATREELERSLQQIPTLDSDFWDRRVRVGALMSSEGQSSISIKRQKTYSVTPGHGNTDKKMVTASGDTIAKYRVEPYTVKDNGKSYHYRILLPRPVPTSASYFAPQSEEQVLALHQHICHTLPPSHRDLVDVVDYYAAKRIGDGGIVRTVGSYTLDKLGNHVTFYGIEAETENEWIKKIEADFVNHEISGHGIERINPYVHDLLMRTVALDGVSMRYGNINPAEYFAVMVQYYFYDTEKLRRFPYGARVVHHMMQLKKSGVSWYGRGEFIRPKVKINNDLLADNIIDTKMQKSLKNKGGITYKQSEILRARAKHLEPALKELLYQAFPGLYGNDILEALTII